MICHLCLFFVRKVSSFKGRGVEGEDKEEQILFLQKEKVECSCAGDEVMPESVISHLL
jgi:hypothetical protein